MAYDNATTDRGPATQFREPMPPRKTCSSYHVFKILSIIYAIIFFLIGAVVLTIGAWVMIVKSDYSSVHDLLTSPAILAVAVGAVMVITALLGIIAAAASKLWPLRVFLAIVIVVFIIQVVIGVVAFVCREQTIDDIDEHLDFAIKRYADNEQVRYAVNKIQTKFHCCGLHNASDWTRSRLYSCDSTDKWACHVPDSCCRQQSEDCGLHIVSNASSSSTNSEDVYFVGCRWKFLSWLENNFDVVGATALGLAILHILGIFVVYMFVTKVEDRYRLFKYRKRFYAN